MWADYCTAAVRTGGAGQGGISALVVPMKTKGVTRRKIENSGADSSGELSQQPKAAGNFRPNTLLTSTAGST